jgi:hypothetical protein
LTEHNIQKRHISTSPVEFEPATPVSERPKSEALDSAATGTSRNNVTPLFYLTTIICHVALLLVARVGFQLNGLRHYDKRADRKGKI